MVGKKKSSPLVEMAMRLHQIVSRNSPMRTLVDSIPAELSVPIPPGMTLPSFLAAEFSKVFAFTQNRAGQVFAEPLLPPNFTVEQMAALLGHVTQSPMAQNVQTAVSKLLMLDPSLATADSLEILESKLENAFFHTFRVPIPVPLSGVLENQFRIIREPVTGQVSLHKLDHKNSIRPSHVQQHNVTAKSAPKTTVPSRNQVFVRLETLQSLLRRNLAIVETALTQGPGQVVIPDATLWSSALDTLVKQEEQGREILENLFDQK